MLNAILIEETENNSAMVLSEMHKVNEQTREFYGNAPNFIEAEFDLPVVPEGKSVVWMYNKTTKTIEGIFEDIPQTLEQKVAQQQEILDQLLIASLM